MFDYGGPARRGRPRPDPPAQATPERASPRSGPCRGRSAEAARRSARVLRRHLHRPHDDGIVGAPVHDPLAVLALTHPDLFTRARRHVAIETGGDAHPRHDRDRPAHARRTDRHRTVDLLMSIDERRPASSRRSCDAVASFSADRGTGPWRSGGEPAAYAPPHASSSDAPVGASSRRHRPNPTPRPARSLTRVLACGICGSDLHLLQHGEESLALSEEMAAENPPGPLDPVRPSSSPTGPR